MIYPGYTRIDDRNDIIVYSVPAFSQTARFEWLNKKPTDWNNGFGYGYVKDNGKFSFYIVNMSPKGRFILFDKEWE